jgi:hypothetical protein
VLVFVPRFMLELVFVPRFMLLFILELPVDVFEFIFDIGVGDVVITAVFEFIFDIVEFVFMFRPLALLLALLAVSPQPETTNAIEHTIAARDPVSLLIGFSWDI